MAITPVEFQRNAAKTAIAAFKSGSKRYLIADETGLGKTIIARAVIDELSKEAIDSGKPFTVYYFGSNLMLLDDTISEKLIKGTEWKYHSFPDRLGMMAGVKISDKSVPNVHVYGFSANLLGEGGSKGAGNPEKWQEEMEDEEERPRYNRWRQKYNEPLLAYADELREKNRITLAEYQDFLKLWDKKYIWKKGQGEEGEDITPLRRVFELYTLEKNAPDLIIFDEIHRYDDKVVEFIGIEGKRKIVLPKILFLSATPYNFYPNREKDVCAEDEGDGKITKLQNFETLLDILNPEIRKAYEEYKKYKEDERKGLSPEAFSMLLKSTCIYRNERLSDGNQKYRTLPTVEEYSTFFVKCVKAEKELYKESRYWKLCSGAYSFPVQVYIDEEEKRRSKKQFYKGFASPGNLDGELCYDEDFIFGTDHKLKRAGEYWKNLRFACIEYYNAKEGRGLLWVPPTVPEYRLCGRFENSSFTKLMIFSAYKMVPRAVSGIFSAYVSDDINVETPVDLSEIDMAMEQLWGSGLEFLAMQYDECRNTLCTEGKQIEPSELIDSLTERLLKIDANRKTEAEYKLTAKYIIGSPYLCTLRAYGKERAKEVRDLFNCYFKKEGIKQAIVYCNIKNGEELLDYCIDGGLGAVLKEYAFCEENVDYLKRALKYGTYEIGKTNKADRRATLEELVWSEDANTYSQVHVYSKDCYEDSAVNKPFLVPCHYAERFNADFSDTGAADTAKIPKAHFKNCHNAFISPFWPMILCTTSANQEGYDLDRYCNRIMHYSLPASTMAFEQRDGRIDRRLSLLARRRMAQLYAADGESWKEMFEHDKGESGMSPYWTQTGYLEKTGDDALKFERIVPYFPMTKEYVYYRRLLEDKNVYRGHFGLPNESNSGIEVEKRRLKLNDIDESEM